MGTDAFAVQSAVSDARADACADSSPDTIPVAGAEREARSCLPLDTGPDARADAAPLPHADARAVHVAHTQPVRPEGGALVRA